jgi:ribosome-associated protein
MAKKQAERADSDKSQIPSTKSPVKRKSVARKTAAPKSAKPAAAKLSKEIGAVVKAALDKKAEDLIVLDLRTAGGFTDFFVICTGGNARQISAIADSVREVLKKDFDERPALAEGIHRSEWVLLDYFDFVVHIFSRECRAFYGLERLWGNAERHEFGDTPERRV